MGGIQQLLLGGAGDIEIVTVKYWTTGYDANYGYSNIFGGSIIDGRFAPAGGAVITALYVGGLVGYAVILTLSQDASNSGFERVTITNSTGGVSVFYRADATFSTGSGSTTWQWPGALNTEFGADGTVTTVVFS